MTGRSSQEAYDQSKNSQQSFNQAMLLQKTKTKTAKPQNENTSKLVVKKPLPTQPLFEVAQCFDVEVSCKQTAEEQFSYMLENLNRSLFKIVLDKAWSKNYTVKFLLEKFAWENKVAKDFASSMFKKLRNCNKMLEQSGLRLKTKGALDQGSNTNEVVP